LIKAGAASSVVEQPTDAFKYRERGEQIRLQPLDGGQRNGRRDDNLIRSTTSGRWRRRSAWSLISSAHFPQPSGNVLPAQANARIADSPIPRKRALTRFGLQLRCGFFILFHVDPCLNLSEHPIQNNGMNLAYSAENKALIGGSPSNSVCKGSARGMMVRK
jgi:hypothetical protein